MCYIVFKGHSLHSRYIKIALQEYVIMQNKLLNTYTIEAHFMESNRRNAMDIRTAPVR